MPSVRPTVLALAMPALLLAGPHAAAVCLETAHACVDSSITEPLLDASGDGVLCVYVKLAEPPPHGWNGGTNQAPYVFTQTQSWGFRYPNDYNFKGCVPACPATPTSTSCLVVDVVVQPDAG
jgi:hypothetical protein